MTFFRKIRHFGRDQDGQLSIEACLMVPLIILVYISTFTYFQTFRAEATGVKAAHSIGDMLSRETAAVNPSYINGMNTVFNLMTEARAPTWIRVTGVTYDEANKDNSDKGFDLVWSYATQGKTKLDQTTISRIRDRIPEMADGDFAVVVETFMPYDPEFSLGVLNRVTFYNVVVTRPRFAPQLAWSAT